MSGEYAKLKLHVGSVSNFIKLNFFEFSFFADSNFCSGATFHNNDV